MYMCKYVCMCKYVYMYACVYSVVYTQTKHTLLVNQLTSVREFPSKICLLPIGMVWWRSRVLLVRHL